MQAAVGRDQYRYREKSEINSVVAPIVFGEWFLAENYISLAVVSAFKNYEARNECKDKLLEIQQTLDKINFFWLEEMDEKFPPKSRKLIRQSRKRGYYPIYFRLQTRKR